jgi:hypothetical protein
MRTVRFDRSTWDVDAALRFGLPPPTSTRISTICGGE